MGILYQRDFGELNCNKIIVIIKHYIQNQFLNINFLKRIFEQDLFLFLKNNYPFCKELIKNRRDFTEIYKAKTRHKFYTLKGI